MRPGQSQWPSVCPQPSLSRLFYPAARPAPQGRQASPGPCPCASRTAQSNPRTLTSLLPRSSLLILPCSLPQARGHQHCHPICWPRHATRVHPIPAHASPSGTPLPTSYLTRHPTTLLLCPSQHLVPHDAFVSVASSPICPQDISAMRAGAACPWRGSPS